MKYSAEATLTIGAVFETVADGLTGITAAKVKRIERQDDGTFTVVIDYWPTAPDSEPTPPGLMDTLRTALGHIQDHDMSLDDPHGDGSGNGAESPTGDDYNDLTARLQPLYDLLGMVGPLSPWEERSKQAAGEG